MNADRKKTIRKGSILLLAGSLLLTACSRTTAKHSDHAPVPPAGTITDDEPAGIPAHDEDEVLYYTCAMHPSVKQAEPGDCPICAMDLIAIHRGDAGKILVDAPIKKLLGIISAPVQRRSLVREIRLPAQVLHDEELYLAEQEYLSTGSSGAYTEAARSAAAHNLYMAGYRKSDYTRLRRAGRPPQGRIRIGAENRIAAEIPERDARFITPGTAVLIYPETEGLPPLEGRVILVAPMVDPMTQSVRTRIVFDNSEARLPFGSFVTVYARVPLGEQLSVVHTAVIDTGRRTLVYIEDESGKYEPRQVTAGVRAGEYRVIHSGLAEGELAVIRGTFLLDSQSTLTGGQSQLYGAGTEVETQDSP